MRNPSATERTFAVIALLLYSGAILASLLNPVVGENTNAESDPISQLAYITTYLITFGLVLRNQKLLRAALTSSPLLLVLLLLVVASIGWSASSDITARRVAGLLGSTVFGYYLAMRYSLHDLLRLVNQALFVAAVLSLVVAVALPAYGLMGALQEGGFHEGAWKGVFTHKNTLGRLMVIHAVTAFVLYSVSRKKQYWLHIALATFLIVMSQSTSALVLALFILALGYVLRAFRLQAGGLVFMLLTLLLLLVAGGYYLANNLDVLFALMGKDLTLTGRTMLWEQVLEAIGKRPVFGYGFSGFWTGKRSAGAAISQELNWEIPNAHSGLLDLLLDLGYVGFGLFVLVYFGRLGHYLKQYSLHRQRIYDWGVMYLLLFLAYNFVESNLLRQNNFFWILFVATVSSYSFYARATRRPRPVPATSVPHSPAPERQQRQPLLPNQPAWPQVT